MFAKPDEMDAQLIGQNRLFNHVPQDLIHRFGLAICAKADIAKAIKTKFDLWHVAPLFLSGDEDRRAFPRTKAKASAQRLRIIHMIV